jgi:hypothetical protein
MREDEDGTLQEMEFEDVVTCLNEDTISYSCSMGLGGGGNFQCGGFGQYLSVSLKVEVSTVNMISRFVFQLRKCRLKSMSVQLGGYGICCSDQFSQKKGKAILYLYSRILTNCINQIKDQYSQVAK